MNSESDSEQYSILTDENNECLEHEKKVLIRLTESRSIAKQQIRDLEERHDSFKDVPEHRFVAVPKLCKTTFEEARNNQLKGQRRCELRGEEYKTPERLLIILEIPSLQEKAMQENKRLADLNKMISHTNKMNNETRMLINYEKKPIIKKVAELNDLISESTKLIEEYEKKLRYIEYARINKLIITNDDMIDVCNKHRNKYICKMAYIRGDTGYSKCNNTRDDCDEIMRFVNYNYAECGCGRASWTMTKIPSRNNFDITSDIADGDDEGFSMFGGASIERMSYDD